VLRQLIQRKMKMVEHLEQQQVLDQKRKMMVHQLLPMLRVLHQIQILQCYHQMVHLSMYLLHHWNHQMRMGLHQLLQWVQ
jgi:hypothetical protein